MDGTAERGQQEDVQEESTAVRKEEVLDTGRVMPLRTLINRQEKQVALLEDINEKKSEQLLKMQEQLENLLAMLHVGQLTYSQQQQVVDQQQRIVCHLQSRLAAAKVAEAACNMNSQQAEAGALRAARAGGTGPLALAAAKKHAALLNSSTPPANNMCQASFPAPQVHAMPFSSVSPGLTLRIQTTPQLVSTKNVTNGASKSPPCQVQSDTDKLRLLNEKLHVLEVQKGWKEDRQKGRKEMRKGPTVQTTTKKGAVREVEFDAERVLGERMLSQQGELQSQVRELQQMMTHLGRRLDMHG